MKPRAKDKSAVKKIVNELNETANNLDERLKRNLSQARAEALRQAGKRKTIIPPPGQWIPATGLAAVLMIVILAAGLWFHGAAPSSLQTAPSEIDYMDIVVDGESPDLYQDMEFYQWLAHEDQSG
ncbi:MAG TPA: hypothetical protein ENK84_04430 [Desulfobulbus sp.]|nr:hypothetical protein [Desulfobulbus sp.]